MLEIYFCLYSTTEDVNKKKYYKTKFEEIINVTNNPLYHDLSTLSNKQLRQISTSYFRAWYLIHKLGFNESYYYKEIKKVKYRIDDHLNKRDIGAKMAFAVYYGQLGFHIEHSMEDLFKKSRIRKRKITGELSRMDIYHITHEVFYLYESDKMFLITKKDKQYLRNILTYFIRRYMENKDIDILAELVMIMKYLNFTEIEEYGKAIIFLIQNQNENGSFGYYERKRESYAKNGFDIDYLWYLHTTEVSLLALNGALKAIGYNEFPK